jgi:hypothetical protein
LSVPANLTTTEADAEIEFINQLYAMFFINEIKLSAAKEFTEQIRGGTSKRYTNFR